MEPIHLYPHNPEWLQRFESEKCLLKNAIGDIAVTIHHIGSTAVPCLLAKPIIDITVECTLFPPNDNTEIILSGIGYECRGESGIPGRIWFIKGHPVK